MRYKRLPNGFGSVVKLKGRRRCPYNARTPVKQYNIKGQPIFNSLGCFKTRQEAIDAITEWHRKGGEVIISNSTTFAEVYDYAMSQKDITRNTINSFNNAFRKVECLHDRKLCDLKLYDLQKALDDNEHLGKSARNAVILIYKMIYKFAIQNDIIDKDYARYVVNKGSQAETTRDKFFSMEDLQMLKDNIEDKDARLILMMCYSGFRPSAYHTLEIVDGKYFKGGIKTKQSKDRIVPIKEELKPLGKFDYAYNNMKIHFDSAIEKYGLPKLTPHACRHTFKYLCDRANVDDITCRMLMGHALGKDVHDKVYSHRTYEELEQAIESLEW